MRNVMLIFIALIVCGCDDYSYNPQPQEYPMPNIHIDELKELYKTGPVIVEQDIIIAGTITSSDLEGNFFKTFTVEQNGAAVEIKAGLYDLHRAFHPGQKVCIKLNGLVLAYENGIMQVGVKPPQSSRIQAEYFDHREYMDEYILRSFDYDQLKPAKRQIFELNEANCGMLVSVSGLRHKEITSDNWGGKPLPEGVQTYAYRILKDMKGDSIAVYTSGYALFAQQAVPLGEMRISGILQYGKTSSSAASKMFILKPRYYSDILSDNI